MISFPSGHKKDLERKKWWLLFGTALAVICVLVMLFYHLATSYILEQAEMRVQDVMMESRALHHYVQQNMHPALYTLKEEDRVSKDFYAPELLSSTYIARHLYRHYNETRQASGLPEIYYHLAASDPRNPVNKANLSEQRLIDMFNAEPEKTQYRDIIDQNGKKYLLYATPFLRVQPRCLTCHGAPESAPQELRDYYQWTGGYGYKVGDVIAIESIRSPLEAEFESSKILLAIFLAIAAVIGILSFVNTRLHLLVNAHTATIRESEKKFRTVFETATDGILLAEIEEKRFYTANNALCRMLGYSQSEIPQITLSDVHPPEALDFVVKQFEKQARGELRMARDIPFARKNGQVFYADVNATPLTLDEKTYLMGVVRDVTERRRVQEQTRRLNEELERRVEERTEQLETANTELKEFAYVVSHDLKAPLRNISQLSQWLVMDYADAFDTQGREMIELLVGRVRRMDKLINGILSYSRIGRIVGECVAIDLNQELPNIIASLAPPEHIRVTIEHELPTIYNDKTRIIQIFQNLIGNAIKFMDKPQGEVTIDASDESDFWIFRVTDNGPGINEKHHEKIFQIFQTLCPRDEKESTGIGLPIVKKIVESYGGNIWVESTPGAGSVFSFSLPKSPPSHGNHVNASMRV